MGTIETMDPGEVVRRAYQANVPLRTASDALALADVSAEVNCGFASQLVVQLHVTALALTDNDDELDFYFQTSYDDGVSWVDLENVHFDNSHTGTPQERVLVFGGPFAIVDPPVTPTTGSLPDDTKVDLPLGSKFRVVTVVTDPSDDDVEYEWAAEAFLQS